ncbi:MAG: metal-dependent hydrolase [Arenicella sp.]
MDSLTQIVLGAAVGEIALGKKIGRKAALYGAVLGTLPDLDVLWVKNAVDSFTEHRSFSHSLIVLFLVSPLFAWLLQRWHPIGIDRQKISFKYLFISVYLVFATHVLLDWFTVYGTQLFWPLSQFPFGLGSVFIVDPLYTVPFSLFLLITIVSRKRLPIILGATLSCSYLLWSLMAQAIQTERFQAGLQKQGIDARQSLTLPMPLNTMLWKNITMVEGGYWVSFRSIFDEENTPLQSEFFRSNQQVLEPLLESEAVQKLTFFTKGFYQVVERDGEVWFSDLRMGGFGNFVFNFNVGFRDQLGNIQAHSEVQSKSLRPKGDQLNSALSALKNRIFDAEIDMFQFFDGAEMVER